MVDQEEVKVQEDLSEEEEISFDKTSAEEEKEKEKVTHDYTGKDISVLKDLEAIRERPGMYIGNTGNGGLHHLVKEVVGNAVDEYVAGYCNKVVITVEKDGSCTVEDNGRGIPVDIVEETGVSGVETCFTKTHAGGKFSGSKGYNLSGGLHGVGLKAVNALSARVTCKVFKNGQIHQIDFINGGEKIGDGLHVVGTCPQDKTGTTINFLPDEKIFNDGISFKRDVLISYARETSYLTKGLLIVFRDLREEEPFEQEFCHEGGIVDFVNFLAGSKPRTLQEPLYFSGTANTEKDGDVFVEVALLPTKSREYQVSSYCNNINTPGNGTHEDGFKMAYNRELNRFYKFKDWLKEKDDNFTTDDLLEGLNLVISVHHKDPQYEGQTKDKLGNPGVRKVVSTVIGSQLRDWLENNPKLARLLFERNTMAYKGRIAAERARSNALGKSGISGMPDKLNDCISKNPEERELFIVEGNSAGGSAVNGRDATTQAILPLRGKILNIEKASDQRIDKNAEIDNMINAIGAGFGNDFDINKARYHKVIIMTDADVDGSHIRILLLTFFYRFMKPLIENGYVYIAQPPLYKMTYQGHDYYCYKEEELAELRSKLPEKARFSLQRYKGLGEMDASQLSETTMEKDKRKLLKVKVEDAEDANNALINLMGDNVIPRKEFITANARFVKNLDIN